MTDYKKQAEEFLKICNQFKLGRLPTETPHPQTNGLSQIVSTNPAKAVEIIKEIDLKVFYKLREKEIELERLLTDIKKVLDCGGRIFLVGCGATGRLSLALETLWRHKYKNSEDYKDKVVSFMAGGDVALIHSIEKFEDFPEYGVRQLVELQFSGNDLLIATTEGGETPFVIGATNFAAENSKHSPYFLYCNPDDILIETVERSKEVILNPKIKKVNLSVGPMALTGSTRMQATTILMYFVGLSLLNAEKNIKDLILELDKLISIIETTKFDFLADFILKESQIYLDKEYVLYESDSDLGISILTDTTERSPTFSLHAFENQLDTNIVPSLSYLYFPRSGNSKQAWFDLLLRPPRTFHWKEVTDRTTNERLLGFDFSAQLRIDRKKYLKEKEHIFKIYLDRDSNMITFSLDEIKKNISCMDLSLLSLHLLLKIMLNNHSTLVMGRLQRYESNLMTWVRASNNKLIDRSVRYAEILLKSKGIEVSYRDLVMSCFKYKDVIGRDEALVLKIVKEHS